MDVTIHCNFRDCHWSKFGRAVTNRLTFKRASIGATNIRFGGKALNHPGTVYPAMPVLFQIAQYQGGRL